MKYFRRYSKESYDETLNHLLDEVEEGELTNSAIKDIQQGLKEIKEGKGEDIEDVAKEFNISL